VNHEGRVSDGLSGDRDPLVVADVKYMLAQAIVNDDVDSMVMTTHRRTNSTCLAGESLFENVEDALVSIVPHALYKALYKAFLRVVLFQLHRCFQ